MPWILVVEDNPTARKMVRLVLETEGFSVVEAADGAAALECARLHPPDLVLQDMILPDMHGADLLRQLRALPGGNEMPIIGLSGFQQAVARVNGSATRLDAFLLKPVLPERLLEVVRQHLSPASTDSSIGAGRHVLLVDDDAVALKLMRVGLEHVGFRVTAAADGPSAMALARRLRPDVILSDVLMPGFDGFDLCLAVRRDPDLAAVRLVLISSNYMSPHDIAEKFGATAFLPRTTDFASIGNALVTAMAAPLQTGVADDHAVARQAHTSLVIEQLQRQAELNGQLTERCALQTAQLSILGGIADAIARYSDVEPVLDDVLGACLDAGGIAKGAVYREASDGGVVVAHAKGFTGEERRDFEAAFAGTDLIARALRGSIVVPRRILVDREWAVVRSRAGVDVAVIVPLVVDHRCMGALFLGSNGDRVTDDDLLSFGRAVGGYMGQALLVTAALAQKRHVVQLRALAQTAVAAATLVSVQEIAQHVTRQARELIGARAAVLDVTLRDGARVRQLSPPDATEDAAAPWKVFPVLDGPHGPIGDLRLDVDSDGALTEHDEAVAGHLAQLAVVTMENARLHQAERAARATADADNRLKDEFLATLSHELRTPLNAIMGWTAMLQNGLDETLTKKAIDTIRRNTETQRQLVSDILDISRIITGKVRLDLGPVDLALTIDDALETFRPTARAKGFAIDAVLDRSGAFITGDVNRLRQVLWNLLSNAVKFTPRGGRVEVRLERVNSHVELTVQDNGPGIAPEFLPRIFDRFTQADGSASREHGGLGLGLALVRHFVELHGGTVSAHNRVNNGGAVFVVKLPRRGLVVDTQDEGRRSPTEEMPMVREAIADLSGVTVLVVDDDRDARDLFRHVLEESGAVVVTATTGEEALGLVVTERPAVVLCDIGMSGKDGLATMREIRGLPAKDGGHVPAVAVTAYGTAQDRVAALRAGFQMHVTKPVGPIELITIVASLANRL